MRIGLFTDQYYPKISGVVTSIKMLYEGLTSLGHECYIFTCMSEDEIKNEPEYKEKKIINFYGRPYPFKGVKEYRYTFFHRKFLKQIKKYNLDIIHVHTEYNISKIAIRASKSLHIPLVHTFHTMWEDYFRYLSPFFDTYFHKQMTHTLKMLFTGPIAKQATIEIVPTKKVLSAKKLYGLSKDIRVIPTGLELDSFYVKNIDPSEVVNLKKKYNITENDFVFSYIGRLSPEKNIPMILNAFSKITKQNTKLLIVGGGPELNDLKLKANDLGITDRTIFTDFVEWCNIPAYYQLGNVFVNASRSETQGLTFIEALASNLPVIAQIDDCLSEIVFNGYNGLLFDEIDDFVKKMNLVVDNPHLVDILKVNTYPSIKRYTKENYAKNVLNVYIDAIEINNKKKLRKQ